MNEASKNKRQIDADEFDTEEYEEMELLERLESLREDMKELKVTTLGEVIARIAELHQKLDNQM